MDIEALALFVRAAELGNITAAGRELDYVPSVASQKLVKLENALGMRLLCRTTRHISLSEDGLAFIPHAQKILSAVDEAYFAIAKGPNTPQQTVKISAPGSFARICLFPAIANFLKAHPNLKVNLVLSDSLQDLSAMGIDVAIRIAELKNSTLVARKIAADHRILCASPGYLHTFGEPRNPDDLEGHRCILLGEEAPWKFTEPGTARRPRMDNVFRTNCGESVRLAAAEGLGIASISQWNAKPSLDSGALVRVMSEFELQQNRDIWAIYPSTKLISSKARLFVEFLISEFAGKFPPQSVHQQQSDDARSQP